MIKIKLTEKKSIQRFCTKGGMCLESLTSHACASCIVTEAAGCGRDLPEVELWVTVVAAALAVDSCVLPSTLSLGESATHIVHKVSPRPPRTM